jgi:glycosidase
MTSKALLWWQRGVIYQIYPRSFMDSNGDGVGDLNGIASKLDYLAALGVDAIWLSPIYPSPMADFGYDVANYTDVDPIFGDLAAFDKLIAAAHARQIKIVIDFVPNHSSDQHPWFKEARSSKTNPKRDWYTWRDAKPDGSLPNNWLSVFGGPAWTLDPLTGQYYLHSFLEAQPDLNWRNPELKAAMIDALRFWLTRGVDGFRIDVAHYIMKDPDLRDNPPNPAYKVSANAYKSMGEYESLLITNSVGHPDVHDILHEIRALLDSFSTEAPRYSVGEIHVFDWAEWAKYYGPKNDELHMPFNFALVGAKWQAPVVRGIVEAIEAAMPAGAWPNYVLSNHDEHRIATRLGRATARTAMMLLLTLRGTPTMYYGDELGMIDGVIPPEREQDPWGKRVPGLGLGRDPERTPMQWSNSANAGFSPAGVETWLPIADGYDVCNVVSEEADSHSALTLTKRLLTLRRENAALYGGAYKTVGGAPDECYVYERSADGVTFLIALNFSASQQTLHLSDLHATKAHIVLSTHLDRTDTVPADLGEFVLRPNEGIIFRLG